MVKLKRDPKTPQEKLVRYLAFATNIGSQSGSDRCKLLMVMSYLTVRSSQRSAPYFTLCSVLRSRCWRV